MTTQELEALANELYDLAAECEEGWLYTKIRAQAEKVDALLYEQIKADVRAQGLDFWLESVGDALARATV